MVSKDHDLSLRRQCGLLALARSNLYYQPKGESAGNLRFMEIIRCLAGHVHMPEKGQEVPGNSVVRLAAHAAAGPQMRTPQSPSFDAPDVFGSNPSDAKHPLPGNICLHV